MKKKLLIVPILLSLLLCINVKAKSFTPDEVDPSTYIVGTHMFTSEGSDIYDGTFTTEWIMSASRSFDADAAYEDMIIYRKQARGGWVNAISGNSIIPPGNFEIEYIDEIKIQNLSTELTISIQGEPAPYMKIIGYNDSDFCDLGDNTGCLEYGIDGIEVYEKTEDGEYRLLDLPGESQDGSTLSYRLFNIKNVEMNIVARVYKTIGGRKEYSEYSNELAIDTKIPTPVLRNNGNPAPYIKFMGIDETQYCEEIDGERVCTIDGLEFYEKNFVTGEYAPVDLPLEIEDDLIGNRIFNKISERKFYVIRAYVEENGERLYSDFSNELEMYTEIPKPVFIGNGHPAPYVMLMGINEEQYCTVQENENNENERICSIDGLEFYEVDSETNEYSEVDLPLEVENDLIGNRIFEQINTRKFYAIRAYKEVDGVKKYSEYSDALEFYMPIPTPQIAISGVTCNSETCEMDVGSGIIHEAIYAEGDPDLDVDPVYYYDYVDLFEEGKNEPIFTGIPTGAERRVTGIPVNTTKSFYARAYTGEGDEKIYGDPSKSIEITFIKDPELVTATAIDVNGWRTGDNQGIKDNEGKYTVTVKQNEENAIVVTDKGMVPYVGGNSTTPKKWVGIIVDFGVQVQGEGYTVMPEDYLDASRWGATSDTAFVLWTTTDYPRTIKFVNTGNPNSKVDFTIWFEDEIPFAVNTATPINVTGWREGDNPGITQNDGKYLVTKKDGNTIVVNDLGLVPYKGGNQPTVDKKWIGILVDFGTKVQGTGYTINEEDYDEASRWGATTDTAFVMWIIAEDNRTIRFTDVNDATKVNDLTIIIEQGEPENN